MLDGCVMLVVLLLHFLLLLLLSLLSLPNDNHQASGALLQEVAGLGGDPDTADLGMEAKKFAGDLTKSLLNGECVDAYNILLTTYEESESTALLDMKVAANLMKAEDALMKMQAQSPVVMKCAEKACSK